MTATLVDGREAKIVHDEPEPEQMKIIVVDAEEMLRTIRQINGQLTRAKVERRKLSEHITGLQQRLLDLTSTGIDNWLEDHNHPPVQLNFDDAPNADDLDAEPHDHHDHDPEDALDAHDEAVIRDGADEE